MTNKATSTPNDTRPTAEEISDDILDSVQGGAQANWTDTVFSNDDQEEEEAMP